MKRPPSKKRRRFRSGTVTGMTASIKYDLKKATVTLTVRGRTQTQADAIYRFSSAREHPAVTTRAGLHSWRRTHDRKVVKADYVIELTIDPEQASQPQLEEPNMYWFQPEDKA